MLEINTECKINFVGLTLLLGPCVLNLQRAMAAIIAQISLAARERKRRELGADWLNSCPEY